MAIAIVTAVTNTKVCARILTIAASLLTAEVSAQPLPQPDLNFPTEARELPRWVPLDMALYKPPGAGPFPALVIYPSGGGLNQDLIPWVIAVVQKGYVALVVDYQKPRGLTPKDIAGGRVQFVQGAKDALQALAHLKTFSFVDAQRIGIMGFSWGGMAALLAGSPSFRAFAGAAQGFTVAVAFYPGCYYPPPPNSPLRERLLLRADHDLPTLILQGEKDNEVIPTECTNRVAALKSVGRPIELHEYPGIGHAWDGKFMDGFRKVDAYGNNIVYRYSKETTEDSSRRAFNFLGTHLRPGN